MADWNLKSFQQKGDSEGIEFISQLKGFEGYMIDKDGIATYTTGFERYCV